MKYLSIAARILGAVGGGYFFSAALVAFGSAGLSFLLNNSRGEATVLMAMIGFVVYLVALLWAFAVRRVWLVWAVLVGGGFVLYFATRILMNLLPVVGDVK